MELHKVKHWSDKMLYDNTAITVPLVFFKKLNHRHAIVLAYLITLASERGEAFICDSAEMETMTSLNLQQQSVVLKDMENMGLIQRSRDGYQGRRTITLQMEKINELIV